MVASARGWGASRRVVRHDRPAAMRRTAAASAGIRATADAPGPGDPCPAAGGPSCGGSSRSPAGTAACNDDEEVATSGCSDEAMEVARSRTLPGAVRCAGQGGRGVAEPSARIRPRGDRAERVRRDRTTPATPTDGIEHVEQAPSSGWRTTPPVFRRARHRRQMLLGRVPPAHHFTTEPHDEDHQQLSRVAHVRTPGRSRSASSSVALMNAHRPPGSPYGKVAGGECRVFRSRPS